MRSSALVPSTIQRVEPSVPETAVMRPTSGTSPESTRGELTTKSRKPSLFRSPGSVTLAPRLSRSAAPSSRQTTPPFTPSRSRTNPLSTRPLVSARPEKESTSSTLSPVWSPIGSRASPICPKTSVPGMLQMSEPSTPETAMISPASRTPPGEALGSPMVRSPMPSPLRSLVGSTSLPSLWSWAVPSSRQRIEPSIPETARTIPLEKKPFVEAPGLPIMMSLTPSPLMSLLGRTCLPTRSLVAVPSRRQMVAPVKASKASTAPFSKKPLVPASATMESRSGVPSPFQSSPSWMEEPIISPPCVPSRRQMSCPLAPEMSSTKPLKFNPLVEALPAPRKMSLIPSPLRSPTTVCGDPRFWKSAVPSRLQRMIPSVPRRAKMRPFWTNPLVEALRSTRRKSPTPSPVKSPGWKKVWPSFWKSSKPSMRQSREPSAPERAWTIPFLLRKLLSAPGESDMRSWIPSPFRSPVRWSFWPRCSKLLLPVARQSSVACGVWARREARKRNPDNTGSRVVAVFIGMLVGAWKGTGGRTECPQEVYRERRILGKRDSGAPGPWKPRRAIPHPGGGIACLAGNKAEALGWHGICSIIGCSG